MRVSRFTLRTAKDLWPTYPRSCIRTSMRRHILSSRRGGCSVAERNGSVPFALCFYPHFRELTLSVVARCTMRSLSFRLISGAAIFRAVSPFGWTKSAIAQSPCMRSEARSGKRSRGLPPLYLRVAAVPGSSPPLCGFCGFALLHRGSLSKPPNLRADRCCRVARRSLRSPTGGAGAPRVCGPRPPPPVSWRSLASVRGYLFSVASEVRVRAKGTYRYFVGSRNGGKDRFNQACSILINTPEFCRKIASPEAQSSPSPEPTKYRYSGFHSYWTDGYRRSANSLLNLVL
jgi:hypothetical protein